MNAAQTVFTVFFAVFWGLVANVQPRWKAFHWAYWGLPQVKRRLALSLMVLNILPIVYFGMVLWMQIPTVGDGKTANGVIQLIWYGAIPAFGAFSPYRLWLSAIERCPGTFYEEDAHGKYRTEDDTKTEVVISTNATRGNFWSGLAYLLLPLAPFLIRKAITCFA